MKSKYWSSGISNMRMGSLPSFEGIPFASMIFFRILRAVLGTFGKCPCRSTSSLSQFK